MALEPSVRLALMEAISHAADEITAEMPAGSVDVRLHGRELNFVVQGTVPTPPAPPRPPSPPDADEAEADGALARITLRIPESVKARAEDRAAKAGVSLNTWLVNVVRAATTDDAAIDVDIDLSSLPFLGKDPFDRAPFGPGRGSRRMTGWV
jgi:hypothetical protein